MEWSNEMVLEFLNLYKKESIIWDIRDPNRKKKQLVTDAWNRIQQQINWESNVDDLKKKKDSLMAYYRILVNRLKNFKPGMGGEDVFKTSWFAFDTLHSFLANNYECQQNFNTEEIKEEMSESRPSDSETSIPEKSNIMSNETLKSTQQNNKKKITAVMEAKTQMDEAFNLLKERLNSEKDDECDLYGRLLAKKLRKLDEDNRLILMNEINNLVFQTEVKARKVDQSRQKNFKEKSPPHNNNGFNNIPMKIEQIDYNDEECLSLSPPNNGILPDNSESSFTGNIEIKQEK